MQGCARRENSDQKVIGQCSIHSHTTFNVILKTDISLNDNETTNPLGRQSRRSQYNFIVTFSKRILGKLANEWILANTRQSPANFCGKQNNDSKNKIRQNIRQDPLDGFEMEPST